MFMQMAMWKYIAIFYRKEYHKKEDLLDYLEQIEYNIIDTDEDTVNLAEKFIHFGFLKRKSYDDCRHIAAAILAGCDFIISWNLNIL